MEYNDGMKKIPFDEEPIIRRAPKIARRENENHSMSSFAKLVICILLISNFVLGILIVNVYSTGRINQVVNDNTINITAQGSSLVSATAKAVLSEVCVSAGTYTGSDNKVHNGSELKYFYNVTSRGSGTIYELDKENGNAYIVTNYHVISPDTSNVYVLLYGSQVPIEVKVVGYTSTYDIAVLKITNSSELKISGAQACSVADSSDLYIGDDCVVIGNALAMGISATNGVVSVPSEYVMMQSGNRTRVIRTSAAINSGNSGGGLFNAKGEFIGVVNAKIENSAVDNIAFAIPANLALSIAKNIVVNKGTLKKLSLGITIEIESSKAVYNSKIGKTGTEYVIKVSDISIGSLANKVSMENNDLLVSLTYDGKTVPVKYLYTIEDNIFNMDKNTNLTIKVLRDNVEKDLNFDLNDSRYFSTVS